MTITQKTDTKPLRVDIGCGLQKKTGYIGIDKSPDVDADYVLDVESERLPFDDSSVDEIYCAHLVEHLRELVPFMNECYRVLKPGGTIEILAPYYTSIQATQDPTHVRFINENTFLYFTSEYNGNGATFDYGIKCMFEIVKIDFGYINIWSKQWIPERIRHWARRHLYNVAVDIKVNLSVVK